LPIWNNFEKLSDWLLIGILPVDIISAPGTQGAELVRQTFWEMMAMKTQTKTADPYKTTFHRDGSITVWNVFTQTWHRTSRPSDRLLATLEEAERRRVVRHCGL